MHDPETGHDGWDGGPPEETLPAVQQQETGGALMFQTSDPVSVITKASRIAQALGEVIRKQSLAVRIAGKDHVRVEGWTLCGSMLNTFASVVWTRKLEDGWEARVVAKRNGEVIGSAEAMCTRQEASWSNRDEYALRSMAQTRATSKALRLPLGFIIQLAGFETTPAEEVPAGGFKPQSKPRAQKPMSSAPRRAPVTPESVAEGLPAVNVTPESTQEPIVVPEASSQELQNAKSAGKREHSLREGQELWTHNGVIKAISPPKKQNSKWWGVKVEDGEQPKGQGEYWTNCQIEDVIRFAQDAQKSNALSEWVARVTNENNFRELLYIEAL